MENHYSSEGLRVSQTRPEARLTASSHRRAVAVRIDDRDRAVVWRGWELTDVSGLGLASASGVW